VLPGTFIRRARHWTLWSKLSLVKLLTVKPSVSLVRAFHNWQSGALALRDNATLANAVIVVRRRQSAFALCCDSGDLVDF